ncbi:MAG: DUF302 domain-containing protein [Candidatus Krumholzibacteriia bacterium]|nr:DUF302 domain-containing protein [bacterium]MCB9513107.1 DUF302 domain-containing protein [Candidatus Latescibacterota bacterium]MCB9516235.1 DUF302 domain-containing protein [Candidatus Latescibacterota bacterium]
MTTTTRNSYGLFLDLPGSVADWRPRAEAALKAEGFGILTEIDVQATLRAKLGEEVPAQVILGACNPPLAHGAMVAETDIGLLLPCNVTLRELPPDPTESSRSVHTRIGIMDIASLMGVIENPALGPIAAQVNERLARVLQALGNEA